MIEKIIARNARLKAVSPGDIVVVYPNRLMIHDIFIPFVAEKFEQMGFTKLENAESAVLIYDHLVPAAEFDDVRHHKIGDAFAKKYGLQHVHRADGICHQLMVEQGYVKPGDVAFGTDSHTTTYGAVGAFSTGIGYTEMAAVLGTGELWVRVPASIRIEVTGRFAPSVYAKDLILRIIGDLGADGATYQALEFCGDTIETLSLAERMTLANMAIEAGAKCAVFAPDETALTHCKKVDFDYGQLRADSDAHYPKTLFYRAEELEPVLACPSRVDDIRPVHKLCGTPVDEVFLGSCTNGRLEDLRIAADIVKGKQVSPFTRFIVTAASRQVYADAAQEGILQTLIEAGATVTLPGCGLCCGRGGGIVSAEEVVLATNNRNFLGRMGDKSAKIYLASPAVAAATALRGEIALP